MRIQEDASRRWMGVGYLSPDDNLWVHGSTAVFRSLRQRAYLLPTTIGLDRYKLPHPPPPLFPSVYIH